jgi:hypothetical protein
MKTQAMGKIFRTEASPHQRRHVTRKKLFKKWKRGADPIFLNAHPEKF